MVLERLSWRVTCPNHTSFRLLRVVRRGSCGSFKEADPVRTQLLVLCSKQETLPPAHCFESLDPFFRVSKQGPCVTAAEKDGGVTSISAEPPG